jgi:hypothetical protein
MSPPRPRIGRILARFEPFRQAIVSCCFVFVSADKVRDVRAIQGEVDVVGVLPH